MPTTSNPNPQKNWTVSDPISPADPVTNATDIIAPLAWKRLS
jgi:hypothetical protein